MTQKAFSYKHQIRIWMASASQKWWQRRGGNGQAQRKPWAKSYRNPTPFPDNSQFPEKIKRARMTEGYLVIIPSIFWKRQTTQRQNRDAARARTTKWYQKRTFWGEENILYLVCDDYTTTFVKINTIIHLKRAQFSVRK